MLLKKVLDVPFIDVIGDVLIAPLILRETPSPLDNPT